jgi:hypothetical protein
MAKEARPKCQSAVESLAKYDFRWVHDFGRDEFYWVSDQLPKISDEIITVAGEQVEFQNGFGGWVRHRYVCSYSRKTKEATAEPGRFPS